MRIDRGLGRLIAGCVVAFSAALSVGDVAQAQNLDQGKSAPQLFSNGCTACHRSPRGLANGRIKLTLYMFLKQHYSAGSDEAWALADYLESAGDVPHGRPRTGAAKHAPHRHGDPVVRPPAPVR
jgi:hypothetical protein